MTHPNSISNIDQFVEDFIFEFHKGLPEPKLKKDVPFSTQSLTQYKRS